MANTTFYVFRMKIYAFSTPKKSTNLLKIQPKLLLIQNFDGFALILLFFEIFRRGKISQKIKMKKKMKSACNCIKVVYNFHNFSCKIMQIFFHIIKVQTFPNKT